MAYQVRHWISVQARKILYCYRKICIITSYVFNRRMNRCLAFSVLGSLFLWLVFATYQCNIKTTQQYSIRVKHQAIPDFIRDFFIAVDEESEPNMAEGEPCTPQFSVFNLSDKFISCASTPNKAEVDMDLYLEGWHELVKFLNSMGKAFSFVGADVVEKVGILEAFRNSEQKEHYETIEMMILYEKKENLINYNEAPSSKVRASGSRTLLRLHRALKFLLLFLQKIAKNEDEGKVSQMGYKAYHASPMARYHPWIVRKAVGIAVYILPDREKFIKNVICTDVSTEKLEEMMIKTSESMDAVFEYTQALYSKYDIAEIP